MMRETQQQKQDLIDLLSEIAFNNLTLVEIGSYAGESAEIFAKSKKFKKKYLH